MNESTSPSKMWWIFKKWREKYILFRDETNKKRKKEREVDYQKLLKEQKRVMNNAINRQNKKLADEFEQKAKSEEKTELWVS